MIHPQKLAMLIDLSWYLIPLWLYIAACAARRCF